MMANKRLIIERVFSLGNKVEFQSLLNFYGTDVIKSEIVNAGSLDKKTLNWASMFLHIPKNKFKCYIKKPSTTIP